MQSVVRIILFLICGFCLHAATYYVRTDGDDGNTGTTNSAEGAWLTIQQAADTIVAGDTVRIQPGTYTENVTEGTGGSAGSLITYLGDGGVGEIKIVGRFTINGVDFVRLVGLEVYQTDNSTGYEGISLISGSDNCQVLNCYIHHTDNIALRIGNSGGNSNVFRWNRIEFPRGIAGDVMGENAIKIVGNNNVAEYNIIRRVGDYSNIFGTNNVWRNNWCGENSTNDFPGILETMPEYHHIDFIQWYVGGVPLYRNQCEANTLASNLVSNGHGVMIQKNGADDGSAYFTMRNNVFWRLGSGVTGFNPFRDGYVLQNTIVDCQQITSSGYTVGFTDRDGYHSTNMHCVGNVFHSACSETSYGPWFYEGDLDKTGTYVNHNVRYQSNDPEEAEVNGIEGDPLFFDYANGDLRLSTNGSPAFEFITCLTTAHGAGANSTSLVVHSNATYFCDGFGMVDGDWIAIGSGAPVQITGVNDDTKTITLSSARSWSDNDSIWFADPVSANKDSGAYPYKADWTLSATYRDNGDGTATVYADPGLFRYVVAFNDHIPTEPSYCSSSSTTVSISGEYEIRAYVRYAPTSANALYANATSANRLRTTTLRAGNVTGP